MIDCIQATATARPSVVECGLGLHGGMPHAGLCARCDCRQPRPPDRFAEVGRAAPAARAGVGRGRAGPGAGGFLSAHAAVAGRPGGANGSGRRRVLAPAAGSKLLLRNFQSPGDVLMLTAAVRDLHRAHPGRYQTAVQTACGGLWDNNPHVVPVELLQAPDRVIECNYPLVHQSNQRPFHFIHGFTQDLEARLGVRIPVTDFRGDVYLSAEEKRLPSPAAEAGCPGRYWVVLAGGKYDFTAKWWDPASYQSVVDHFAGKIRFVQCGEPGHWHPPLNNVVNFIGKTADVRRFLRLVYHADGVLCPVTFAMHLSAALDLPPGRVSRGCVVIAGGREPTQWEMYPGHQFLHTQGALDCCATGGCWKSRCQPVEDGDGKNDDLCVKPVEVRPGLRIARCMNLIDPARVIRAIELYYEGGALPPVGAADASGGPTVSAGSAPPPESPALESTPPQAPAYEPAALRPARTYSTDAPRVGLVVATFAAVPYVHLHLESWSRHYRHVPLLVSDDGSPYAGELEALCTRYGASFVANPRRLRRTVGDLSAYVHGFDWAASKGLDVLVKMSRRFVPCHEWVPGLQRLAHASQMPTFSQCCDHFNFGFRTECVGFHCASWRQSGGYDRVRGHVDRNEPAFVEGFVHELARSVIRGHASIAAGAYVRANPRRPDRDAYAPWPIMADKRSSRSPGLLWHDCDGPFDYCRAAALYGLNYGVDDFEDPNQGCGLGEP